MEFSLVTRSMYYGEYYEEYIKKQQKKQQQKKQQKNTKTSDPQEEPWTFGSRPNNSAWQRNAARREWGDVIARAIRVGNVGPPPNSSDISPCDWPFPQIKGRYEGYSL